MESAVKQGIPLILLGLICVRVKQVKIFIYTFNSLNWELVNSRPLKQPRYAGRVKHKCLNNVSEHQREKIYNDFHKFTVLHKNIILHKLRP